MPSTYDRPKTLKERIERKWGIWSSFEDDDRVEILKAISFVADKAQPNEIIFWYTNHRRESAYRRVVPHSLRWGTSDYYPDPQLLLKAFDCDKNAEREFAVAGMSGFMSASPIPFVLPGAVELRTALANLQPAITSIRDHQTQVDPDGIAVGVSRQAVDEVLQFLALFSRLVSEGRV